MRYYVLDYHFSYYDIELFEVANCHRTGDRKLPLSRIFGADVTHLTKINEKIFWLKDLNVNNYNNATLIEACDLAMSGKDRHCLIDVISIDFRYKVAAAVLSKIKKDEILRMFYENDTTPKSRKSVTDFPKIMSNLLMRLKGHRCNRTVIDPGIVVADAQEFKRCIIALLNDA